MPRKSEKNSMIISNHNLLQMRSLFGALSQHGMELKGYIVTEEHIKSSL